MAFAEDDLIGINEIADIVRNANFMGSAGHVSWTSNAIGHSQQ
ncbi:hypothetical protein [Brevundimonas sp. Marseille-Q4549]